MFHSLGIAAATAAAVGIDMTTVGVLKGRVVR